MLPWYKSKTAVVGVLAIATLITLKAYANYNSARAQELTVQRISSLSQYELSTNESNGSSASSSRSGLLTHGIEEQALAILASDSANQEQKKLAAIYLSRRSYKSS